jgi:trans-aconitate methyltransferase
VTQVTDAWQARSGEAWCAGYWNSDAMPHRNFIIQGLRLLRPFSRVLEIGCHCGPNLRRVHREWPLVDLAGMDVNAEAVGYGLNAARAEGWEWDAYVGDFTKGLGALKTPYDVVVSCYALAYCTTEEIRVVMDHVMRLARRGVVLAEPMARWPGKSLTVPEWAVAEFAHDYGSLVRSRTEGAIVTRWEIDPPVDRLNGVVVARFASAKLAG